MSAPEEDQNAGSGEAQEPKREVLQVKRHAKYFVRVLNVLPNAVSNLDSNRMTLVFFALSGLDLLGALDENISDKRKEEIIDWIYAQQILPEDGRDIDTCGFRGGSYMGVPYPDNTTRPPSAPLQYDIAHVTMAYTALACLLILGDDLSRVNRQAVLAGVRRLQLPDGSFVATAFGSENDMRFVYCAACVCYMLGDWSGMDTEKAAQFIKRSQGYDYGIGQGPFMESHGGTTFCGVAALSLMGKLDTTFSATELEGLRRWCLLRQKTGFEGRPNKVVDTCYSFWVGASLQLLGVGHLVDKIWNRFFVMSTQADYGGLAKWPDHNPDPMHTYLGLSGLSLNKEESLRPVHPALNVSQRAADWLHKLQTSI